MPEFRLKPWTGTALASLIQSFAMIGKDFIGDREGRARALSDLGGFVGAPFGMLPILGTAYSAGLGQQVSMDEARAYKTFRLSPEMVINLWRRSFPDTASREKWFSDLKDVGWSDDQITGLKQLAQVLPTPQDIVSFLAHEVYEPTMIQKYGLDDEWDTVDKSKFAPVGLSEDTARDYWRNHWQHASFQQVVEMRRREMITDQDVYDWFKLVEIPPFWRKNLTELLWEVPTRVDIRRFLDMGTINETRLREYYGKLGYHGKDLDDYVLWTKVYNAFPDLVARYKNTWINSDTVISELVRLGMSQDKAQELFETKIKNPSASERLLPEKDLVKSDIIAGFKRGILTSDETETALMGLNYDADEAAFIVKINTPILTQPKRDLAPGDILQGCKLGILEESEAKIYLSRLGYDDWETDYLLKLNGAKKAATDKQLSKTDIVKGYKTGILEYDKAIAELVRIGYDSDESTYILAINKPTTSISTP